MKMKKILVAVLTLAILTTSFMGNGLMAKAYGATAIVLSEENLDLVLVPGETHRIKLPIKAVGGFIATPKIEVVAEGAPFTISKPTLSMLGVTVNGISQNETTNVEFDVKVSESAEIGVYPVTLNVTFSNFSGEDDKTVSLETRFRILEEKAPAQLTIKNVVSKNTDAGCDTDLSFTIQNEGEIKARNVYMSLNYGETGIDRRYTAKSIKVGDVAPGKEQNITIPISILSTASAGRKTITVNFTYKDLDGNPKTSAYDIYVTVARNEAAPRIEVESITYNGEIKAGDDFILVATLRNHGESRAMNVNIKVDESSIGTDGFIKNYFTEAISLGAMKSNSKLNASVPLIVSKEATSGLKELKLKINYTDENGVAYSSTATIYPEIIASGAVKEDGTPNIIINAVNQNPSKPMAGERLEVSFDMVNKGLVDIKEVKIYMENLMGNTFIPVDSEPYQYIELLKGGEKKRIVLPLTLSDNIPEGLNNLVIKYTYAGNQGMESVTIPIRDVQNEKEAASSKPKLIISNYTADVEELRAGSTFNFMFDILNTNSSVAAKNITVTVSQPENIFAVTQGSNSFFINKIDAGETVQKSIELKIKSDASTKVYPIEILIDYEYDGAEPNPQTGEIGENKVEKLNLQVIENSRPVVDYVNVYSWDGAVSVFNPATLAFEFYNMGKSPLNNVVVTVEGDFTKSDGNMYFIGNVMAGGSTYAEFGVMPNIEGTARGILKIVFEDSNGDEVEMTKEFEAFVQGETNWNGEGKGEFPYDDVFAPSTPQPKKAILPTWAFILIQVAIFILFIPITRKVIISVYKAKLRKKEEEKY